MELGEAHCSAQKSEQVDLRIKGGQRDVCDPEVAFSRVSSEA